VLATLTIYAQTDCHVEYLGQVGYDPGNAAGEANFVTWIALANAAGCDAAISMGDMVQTTENVPEAGNYLDTLSNSYAVMGNHEMAVPYATTKATAVTEYSMPSSYYVTTIGFLRLIILDDQYDEFDADYPGLAGCLPDTEIAWLAGELNAWPGPVLVCNHHPIVSTHFNTDDIVAILAVLGTRSNIWFLNGHIHPTANVLRPLASTFQWTLAATVDGKYSIITITQYSHAVKFAIAQQTF
jgi:hypothetical protein